MSEYLVVDYKNSEVGEQRRRDRHGRLLHSCCICGKLDRWGKSWSFYGSLKDEDDCVALPKFCSKACQSKGGARAELVTDDMKKRARDAEWRGPKLAYREATQAERYRMAVERQRLPTPVDARRE